MTEQPVGPRCGNNPNVRMSDGDRKAVADFKARLALQASVKPYIDRAAWVDGDPLMEVIAHAVWERCARDDEDMPQLVCDDPRTIAAFAAAVARAHADAVPPPADRAAVERVRAVLETEAVVGRSALEYRGLVAAALMAAEAQQQTETLPSIHANDVEGFCPACGHPTLRVGEDGRLTCTLMDCPNPDAANGLSYRLEAVLTERFTELGNPFSRMRIDFQGPDGWPASREVGPHDVADVLRELLAAVVAAVAGEEPATETRAPRTTWMVECTRRGEWKSWSPAYEERSWGLDRYESAISHMPGRRFRLVCAATTYTVEAEHNPESQ